MSSQTRDRIHAMASKIAEISTHLHTNKKLALYLYTGYIGGAYEATLQERIVRGISAKDAEEWLTEENQNDKEALVAYERHTRRLYLAFKTPKRISALSASTYRLANNLRALRPHDWGDYDFTKDVEKWSKDRPAADLAPVESFLRMLIELTQPATPPATPNQSADESQTRH